MNLVILDTETTGIKQDDRICQLSYIVSDEDLEIKEIYNELVKPPIPISFESMAIHHITNEMVEDKPKIKFSSSFKKLKELNSNQNIIVIHNAKFDLEMLKKEDFNPHFQLIDTFRVLKHLIPDGKYSLQYNRYALGLYKKEQVLIDKFNIQINAHDALGDVVVLYLLLEYILKEFKLSINDLIELTKKPILYDKFYQGKYKFKEIKEVIINDPDYIEYLLEQPDLEDDLEYSIKYYLQNLQEEPIYKFSIGKYKGMRVEDVYEIDKQYLNWAFHNMKMSKGMRNKIANILKGE